MHMTQQELQTKLENSDDPVDQIGAKLFREGLPQAVWQTLQFAKLNGFDPSLLITGMTKCFASVTVGVMQAAGFKSEDETGATVETMAAALGKSTGEAYGEMIEVMILAAHGCIDSDVAVVH